MTKIQLKVQQESGNVQTVYLEFLDIGQREEATQVSVVESFRRKFREGLWMFPADLQFFYQGKQTELVKVPEWFGPYMIRVCVFAPGWHGKGVVEMGDGSDVPGITGQGACDETARVIDKMGNDKLDDLRWEPCGRGWARR